MSRGVLLIVVVYLWVTSAQLAGLALLWLLIAKPQRRSQ
jgi:hypothetical protein